MKTTIKNRKNQNIVVLIDNSPERETKGLVFIAHGLGGFMEQPQIAAFAEAFKNSGYTVIRWDAANTIGESGGRMEDATLTSYFEDMEDVINWAKNESWYQEPFVLCGHSLGGTCSILFAAKNPKSIKAIVPVSPFVAGEFFAQNYSQEQLDEWKKQGYKIEESKSKPGVMKKLSWELMEDLLTYNLLNDAKEIKVPTLLIYGENDEAIPQKYQSMLFKAIPTENKELHMIKNAPHTFKNQEHLEEIKNIVKKWLQPI